MTVGAFVVVVEVVVEGTGAVVVTATVVDVVVDSDVVVSSVVVVSGIDVVVTIVESNPTVLAVDDAAGTEP